MLTSDELRQFSALAMLGAAGLGKTAEQKFLADLDRVAGLTVHSQRLAVLGQSSEALAAALGSLAERSTSTTAIYLDALDEAMVPVRTAGLAVANSLRSGFRAHRPQLRISCRTAVWPQAVQEALADVYGEAYGVARLQPLTEADVLAVASARGIDGEEFLATARRAGVLNLAEQPLTLGLLFRLHESEGAFPQRRRELFERGMTLLAREPRERTRDGTAVLMPTVELLEAAERLACYSLLSGREVIDLADWPINSALGVDELESLPADGRRLDAETLTAISRTGLCEGAGPDRFRFAHRQFAEFLAGRRIAALLPHQARALLGTAVSGVAGPLRETAAFAAMESSAIAQWVADEDPEVVGLSDVAEDAQRRQATLNILSKFRTHELTSPQLRFGGIALAGFRYPRAEKDLRPVLAERKEGNDDVIECVIDLIECWELTSLSDDLATLALDNSAPLHCRVSAAAAVAKLGDAKSRARLLPLVAGGADDPQLDLKGVALQCNWPERMSTAQLLDAVSTPPNSGYYGSYQRFLSELEESQFDCRECLTLGLKWARQFIRRNRDYEYTFKIAKRIARASLAEIDKPGVAAALADLLLDAAHVYAPSPFESSQQQPEKSAGELSLKTSMESRRRLIDALTLSGTKKRFAWLAVTQTPELLQSEDCGWLIRQAADANMPLQQRVNYAEIARMSPWADSVDGVEAWLEVGETEPLKSMLSTPLRMDLDSEESKAAKKLYARISNANRPKRTKPRRPREAQKVAEALLLGESSDFRFFHNVCYELAVDEDGVYRFERFLTTTSAWTAASDSTRTRIVELAKWFLVTDTQGPSDASTEPLNSILHGHLAAMFLIMELEPAWLESLPAEWWKRWAWCILRELHPSLNGEPAAPKTQLLKMLHASVPAEVRIVVTDLAESNDAATRDLLAAILTQFLELDDGILDERLVQLLNGGRISDDRLEDVARFVLERDTDRGFSAVSARLEPAVSKEREDGAVRAAVSLLATCTRRAWPVVFEFLNRRRDLCARVLGEFAYSVRRQASYDPAARVVTELPIEAIGQLVGILLEIFPPAADPQHGGEAYSVGPAESARELRNRLVSWLAEQKGWDAVEVLRGLETRYRAQNPWLRYPRAQAERAYRQASWEPLPPSAVATVLTASEKRLLRSESDALDGLVAATNAYERHLQHEGAGDLDDLWNRPRGRVPTPKEEERVSEKVSTSIRAYFEGFSVAVGREVQVYRRLLSRPLGGAPSSEVDVLCELPVVGGARGARIAVPIEVKLAHNPDALTGLSDQLVGRYMRELGTDVGLYVVLWMGEGASANGTRSLWQSPKDAREELEEFARRITSGSKDPIDIRIVVIDASLPEMKKKTSRKAARKAPIPRSDCEQKKSTKTPGQTGKAKSASKKTTAKPKRR